MRSAELGFEYKEAFNRKLRTTLPEEQSLALEQLEGEPTYDVRKQGMLQVLESALTKLKSDALSEASLPTTTANTTTTTTTIVADASLGSVSSQHVDNIEIKQAASRILDQSTG